MTKVYKEGGNHKKLLVPVMALLLCAFAVIGAGYAFLDSTARSTGNTLDGDVITVKIADEDGVYGSVFAKSTLDYGYYSENGTGVFYIDENPVVIGTGTLAIDVSNYAGSAIEVAKALTIETNFDNNSLEDQFEIEIVFDETEIDFEEDFKAAYEIGDSGTLIELDFEVKLTFLNVGQMNILHIDDNGEVAIFKENAITLANSIELSDLATGIEYTLIFSVFPIDSVDP